LVFTRKYKPEPTEPLRLGGRKIAFNQVGEIFMSFLNPKLNWKQHFTGKRNKFYSYMWACRRVMGKSWGINPLNAELNPICHFLALLGAHHVLHISRIRVKPYGCTRRSCCYTISGLVVHGE
jgi:hypothetical protein